MKRHSPTKIHGKESVSNGAALNLLDEGQRQLMICSFGKGLWELISEDQTITPETMNLIRGKLVQGNLLPEETW